MIDTRFYLMVNYRVLQITKISKKDIEEREKAKNGDVTQETHITNNDL